MTIIRMYEPQSYRPVVFGKLTGSPDCRANYNSTFDSSPFDTLPTNVVASICIPAVSTSSQPEPRSAMR